MIRKLLGLAVFVIGAGLIPAQVQYAKRITEIHAGVLLVNSWQIYDAANLYSYPANGDPYVWYNLGASRSVKPADWTFTNPHGSTVITDQIYDRWVALQGAAGGNVSDVPLPTTQTLIGKDCAPYWEVFLDAMSDGDLADYDVLSLSIHGVLSLTPSEREKLRGYMDQGGVLWVDLSSDTVIDSINNVPVAIDQGAAPGSLQADLQHPILNRPNQVSLQQVMKALSDGSSFIPVNLATAGASSINDLLQTLEPDFNKLSNVAHDLSGNSVLGVARVGNGFIVVTSGGMGDSLNRGKGGAGNPDNNHYYAARPSLDEKSLAAGSVIVNAISLGGSYNESFTGSRKTSSSTVDLHAPLLRQFYASLPLAPGNRNFVPPATYKGLFVISANDRIYVYDGNPGNDLDGDGNPDDGVPDTDLSSGLDLLWVSATMPGPISSPTCITVPTPTSPATGDQILVVDTTGAVHAFDAFSFMATPLPADLNNVAEEYQVTAPIGPADFDLSEDGRGPFAPTIHEGYAYVADTQSGVTSRVGRLWVMNPATGAQVQTALTPWFIGGSSSSALPEVSGPATIGYIPIQDNSGGQDLVAYLPTRPDATAIGSPTQTAGVTSMWLGAKGEKPQEVLVNGSTLEVRTRANLSGLKVYVGSGSDPLGIKVSVVRASNGVALTAAEMAALFDGSVTQAPDGVLTFGLSGAWDPDYSLRMDYRLDWGSGSLTLTDQVRRGFLAFPDAARTRRVLGAVALGPNGNFFVSVSDQARGGSVYAFREEGRGLFRMLYRYELYDQHTITMSSAAPVTYRETFINEDPIAALLGSDFQGPLTNLTLQGAPAVRGGLVYATATATLTSGLPVTVLMAFKADPEPVRIPIGNVTDTFVLVQPDIARSVNLADPETFSIMQPSQFTYEAQGDTGYVAIENLMASRSSVIQNALSSSQPVILRQSGQPDKLIDPDSVGGRWSPLVWYTMLEGTSTQSPPMVTGNTIFVSGNSKLPDILAGIATGAATDRGVMFAMDADVQSLPPIAFPNTVKPWMSQVPLLTSSGSGVQANEVIRWPQGTGVTSFNDWKARYYQTALRPGDTTFGLAAGDGALFTWGPSTVYGFTRGDLLIADEGRLLRLDGAGNPVWSSDTSFGTGSNAQQTNTTTIRTLVRPVRAYRLGSDQVVVADPAGNRVVRLNVGGKEIRSLTGFTVDSIYKPDGYVAGSPMKFNAPTDIATYAAYVPAASNFLSNPSALEYWVYYLVADSGNKRLLEIVDRYVADPTTRQILDPVVDLSGNRQFGTLTWHSPANYSGKNFRYNSVARVYNPTTNKFTYAGGIGNATPTSTDLGLSTTTSSSSREAVTGNGGIILFDGASSVVVNTFTMPTLPANVYYNDTSLSFASAMRPQRERPIGNVNSVTMRYVNQAGQIRLAIMFTDASGVYEIYQPTVGPDQPWACRWALPREMYRSMRRDSGNIATADNPRDLTAMFARRLDSGEVIIANGFLGKTRGQTQFNGEVILLNGDFDPAQDNALPGFDFGKQNFGFSSLSIRLSLSTLTDIRSITAPVFADLK